MAGVLAWTIRTEFRRIVASIVLSAAVVVPLAWLLA